MEKIAPTFKQQMKRQNRMLLVLHTTVHVRYHEKTLPKASRENVIKAISETIRFLVRTVHGKTIEYEDASCITLCSLEVEHANYDKILCVDDAEPLQQS